MKPPQDDKLTAWGYARVSTTDQTSTKEQAERFKEFCTAEGITLAGITIEKKSAKDDPRMYDVHSYIKKRPALAELIYEKAGKDFNLLLIYKWDRLARSDWKPIIQNYLKVEKSTIVQATDDPNDPFGSDIHGAMAKQENRLKQQRTIFKHRGLLKEKRVLNRPPLGYRFNSKHQLVPDENAKAVKQIFEMTSQGHTVKEICDAITIKRKIKGKVVTRKLPRSTYYDVIKNKTYIGIYQYRGEELQGAYKNIITEDEWSACQR